MNLRHAATQLFLIVLVFILALLLAIGAIRVTKAAGWSQAAITSLAASIPVWFFMGLIAWKRRAKADKRASDDPRLKEK
jgi:hypothetical protein